MAIREDLVASAAQFLKDPSVAASPTEKKIAFLQAKNLTQEEINAALARAGVTPPVPAFGQPPVAPGQPSAYYGQYPPSYPPYGWQQPPDQPPRRDWRDWFIMATVVSGVSYGLYQLGKRYIYPLIAPPTPERLEQDKRAIDEQFEKAFALVDQLAKDTEELKAAEQARTEKLDNQLSTLDTVIKDLQSNNKWRTDETRRLREELQNLKDNVIPRALNNQKDLTDQRLREVNAELKSLKTLLTQRMQTPAAAAAVPTATAIPRPPSVASSLVNGATSSATTPAAAAAAASVETAPAMESKEASAAADPLLTNRFSPFSSGLPPRASIPAWQLAASNKSSSTAGSSTTANRLSGGSSSWSNPNNGEKGPSSTSSKAESQTAHESGSESSGSSSN
ncbi:putative peroxisomal membrane anchor protein [Thermochaetoides thermophila DSM 1495]|uniref:Peroxisomal membrane protein PEX14 n=1 Tax=Chaetomium thermophilum (strain DSM 1495 / CBS 144.50 / IMI 039719) TaxID=759272 RepID=G0S8W7_CHATD|nr:putative peroxisomal membrane anchor protein [Thermochaetoides thermophila DSM 1495]EGS19878.1 putative peroxisomal membrane anchor protein [Thermochaetoides thermophila DSM 1495]